MQEPLRTLVVEDEQDSLDLMQKLIKDYCPELTVCGMATNVKDGIEKIKVLKPEVVLLDVSLGQENSFDILSALESKNFITVFTTAYENYALKAFENDAVYYLLKPYSISGVRKMVEKISDARKLLSIKNVTSNKYAVTTLGETTLVDVDTIIYFEASRSYSRLYLNNKSNYLISKPLAQVEKDLDNYNFFRIHNSYFINLNFVVKLIKEKDYTIQLSDKTILPVSRNKKEELVKRLNVR